MSAITVDASVTLSPIHLAEAYWEMDTEQQADFFAHLGAIAGINLCFQTACVAAELYKRDATGDRYASRGFNIMLAHSQEYLSSMLDTRVWAAQRDFAQQADAAKHHIAALLQMRGAA